MVSASGGRGGWRFRDRSDAGRKLAAQLQSLAGERPVILGLPRGGVPVAGEVARVLEAPLCVLPVRKIGAPDHRELGVGAIASGGISLIDWEAVRELHISIEALQVVVSEEQIELKRQERTFAAAQPDPCLKGRTAVIVDDGLATGVTALAAIQAARAGGATRVVLAVPVAAPETVALLRGQVDDLVCLEAPANFYAVGRWYRTFDQTSDATVIELLRAAQSRVAGEDTR
jgi:putative phosphoribosyl transferase